MNQTATGPKCFGTTKRSTPTIIKKVSLTNLIKIYLDLEPTKVQAVFRQGMEVRFFQQCRPVLPEVSKKLKGQAWS